MITIHVHAEVQVANFPVTIIATCTKVYVTHNYKTYTYYKATLHS